ncbi:hypothetical protein YPPY45_4854, partial [Yersinia pestis PY-45]
MNGEDRQKSKA